MWGCFSSGDVEKLVWIRNVFLEVQCDRSYYRFRYSFYGFGLHSTPPSFKGFICMTRPSTKSQTDHMKPPLCWPVLHLLTPLCLSNISGTYHYQISSLTQSSSRRSFHLGSSDWQHSSVSEEVSTIRPQRRIRPPLRLCIWPLRMKSRQWMATKSEEELES